MPRRVLALACVVALAACGDNASSPDALAPDRLLIYTRTLGHRHQDLLDAGLRVLPPRLAELAIEVDHTEDPAAFTTENLARYRAVMFLRTTGNDILDPTGKLALEGFVRGGGGFVATHSATDTEYEWPFYQELIVAHYAGHPVLQPGTLHVEDREHPATRTAPDPWSPEYDEWYNFTRNPRSVPGVRVLVTIDESTYTGGALGSDHPMVWCHDNLGGRMFYSQLFHNYWRWDEPDYVDLVVGGVTWVLGRD